MMLYRRREDGSVAAIEVTRDMFGTTADYVDAIDQYFEDGYDKEYPKQSAENKE